MSVDDWITDRLGYLLNRSCPAQRVGLGRSDLAELNQRPGPMTFSYRSCSTYVNSPDARTGHVRGRVRAPGGRVMLQGLAGPVAVVMAGDQL